jgi:hypothetical protein
VKAASRALMTYVRRSGMSHIVASFNTTVHLSDEMAGVHSRSLI